MKEIKVYTAFCLTCNESDRLTKIKRFASDNNLILTMKQAYVFPKVQEEAKQFNIPMPFIEIDGKTMSFFSVSSDPRIDELSSYYN